MPRFVEDVEIVGASLLIKEAATLSPLSGEIALPVAGKTRVHIKADNQTVTIFNHDKNPALRFNSRSALLEVGGQRVEPPFPDGAGVEGIEGDIHVYDQNGRIRVYINGNDGSIRFTDASAHDRIHIVGQDGAIKVFGGSAIKVWDSALAVEFDIETEFIGEDEDDVRPGMVMVMGTPDMEGKSRLRPCGASFRNRVMGVIMEPAGIILDHNPSNTTTRWPIAVAGKVSCLVQADAVAVLPGDVLATSETLGQARLADDLFDTTVRLGKALERVRPDESPKRIPVLLAL
jgi:hypothetical protein